MIWRSLLGCIAMTVVSTGLIFGQGLKEEWSTQKIRQELKSSSWLKHSFAVSHQYKDPTTGWRHIYLQQILQDLDIFGKVASLHFNERDSLFHSNNNFINIDDWKILSNVRMVSEKFVTQKILETYDQDSNELQTKLEILKDINRIESRIQLPDIKMRKAWVEDETSGKLIPVYVVIWRHQSNQQWLEILVNGLDGNIIKVIDLIKSCSFEDFRFESSSRFELCENLILPNSYRVFPMPMESPLSGSRSIVTSPWDKAVNASPFGWHGDGLNFYYSTRGNNVDAFEDADDDDLPTGGDAARAVGGFNLEFDFPYDPKNSLSQNKDASVTNLFYWTNLMHDIWYQYGFHEMAGNFQVNNFNRGGIGNDPVLAQGFDNIYYARNNANFGTAPDGNSGILQMYMWTQPVYDTLKIESPQGLAGKFILVHSPITPPLYAPMSRQIVLVQDASSYPTFACSNLTNGVQLAGKIAMVDKGICSFYNKIQRIQSAGAVGVLICNNDDTEPSGLGGWSYNMTIPVCMMRKADCERIKFYLGQQVIGTMFPTINLKFSVNQEKYIFSRALFGAPISNLQAGIVQVLDNGFNGLDGCDQILNGGSLNGKIAIVDEGNCEPAYKAYQAQNYGAVAVIVCKQGSGYPDVLTSGSYGQYVRIPVIGLSALDCQQIRLMLPVNGQLKNETPPLIDGDFDAGVVCHEYAHGISLRLTGGANNVDCLNNAEQMGEGWSDFFGLVMTMQPTDYAYKPRGIGNFCSGQSVNGNGLRPFPYHVSLGINPAQYGQLNDIVRISQPHGIGYIWCSMLWDLFWAMVKQHGFNPDYYDADSNAGNAKVFKLIVEGMKLQPCSPGFVDARNAILLADNMLFNGDNYCIIWNVFARRGLGYYANQGSSDRRDDGLDDFSLPPGCSYLNEQQLFGSGSLANDIISLLSYPVEDYIQLTWQAPTGDNVIDKYIQKKSENHSLLERLNVSSIKGNENTMVDKNVENEKWYYYQMVVELRSGRKLLSDWVSAKLTGLEKNWNIFPNPVNDYLILRSNRNQMGALSIHLINDKQQVLDKTSYFVRPGQEIKMQCHDLLPGNYILLLEREDSRQILKFVKY